MGWKAALAIKDSKILASQGTSKLRALLLMQLKQNVFVYLLGFIVSSLLLYFVIMLFANEEEELVEQATVYVLTKASSHMFYFMPFVFILWTVHLPLFYLLANWSEIKTKKASSHVPFSSIPEVAHSPLSCLAFCFLIIYM